MRIIETIKSIRIKCMKKILAIDDNEINLELLNQIVKIYYPEYIFLKSTSGHKGIELAMHEKPEIILLDILMPEINGYEVCLILKKEELTKDIPIIMISALGKDPAERTKGLNVGADSFISKPFSRDEIRAQINVALRIKKVEDLLRKRNESLEIFIKNQTNEYLQNEERVLQISEHALEFYWEVDTKGIFTFVSPVVEKTLRVKQNEIIGEKSYLELFQLKNGKSKENEIENSFKEKSSCKDCEIEIAIEKGKNIWLSVSSISVFNKDGQFYGLRGVCYDVTKRKQAEIELKKYIVQIKKYQKKIKNMNAELTLVEEKERRRIAENLHDSLGQTLSLAFIKLSSIDTVNFTHEERKIIEETSSLLDSAVKESRNITYDLSPPILYELGIIPAFKWKLEQIEENHGIRTKLIGEDQQVEVEKDYEIFLYRIVCELLANVIKHANAKSVEINIEKSDRNYYVTVEDDGEGFIVKNLNQKTMMQGGFGLLSIIERLDSIKGKFSIESEINKGTVATIAIPVQKK